MSPVEHVPSESKAKGCLIGIGVLIIVAASFSHLVTTSEAVPNRAKFVYDRTLKIIMPCPQPGHLAFHPVPGKFDDVRGSVNSEWDGVAIWEQVRKKDGAFTDFALPEGEGWDEFVFYGKPIPLWRDILFSPPSRWDEDGYWRY